MSRGRHIGDSSFDIDVFNPYFLSLSHPSGFKGSGFSLLAAGGEPLTGATGGHTVSPSETCCAAGTQLWFSYLLFCFHRSFCSPIG